MATCLNQFTPRYQINISILTTKGNCDALCAQERLLFYGHLKATNFWAKHFFPGAKRGSVKQVRGGR